MTISSPVSRVDVPGNGSATSFSFSPAIISQASDLMVWLLDNLGNETLLSQGTGPTNYAVVVTSYPGTGSITYPGGGGVTLATGWKLIIKQRAALLQQFNPQNQGPFLAGTYGNAFDYHTMNLQNLQEQILRAVLAAESDTGGLTIPTLLARANQMAGWDGSGNFIAAQPASALVSTAMQPVVNSSTISAAINLLFTNVSISHAWTQALTGHFYQTNGALVNRMERLLVGQATLQSGNLVLPVLVGTAGGWLDAYQAEIGLEPTSEAQTASITDSPGGIGVLGAARSKNHTVSGQSSIGVAGYSYNDHASLATAGWAYYAESYRRNNTVGNQYAAEMAIVNQSGTANRLTPYTSAGALCIGYQVDSGNGFNVALQPGLVGASAAYTIVQNTSDNSAAFLSGIVALANSIAVNGAGAVHEVMALPISYGIQWYNASGSPNSYIYGTATAATNAAALQFNTAGATFVCAADAGAIAAFTPVATAVNYINIQSAATGNPPSVNAIGANANINLVLSPKGTASVLATSGVLPFTDNAYTCGANGSRWSAVWAVNGAIQTSDPRLKTDMAPLPAALPILAAINPIMFKWKSGGPKPVERQVEIDEDVFEEYEVEHDEPVLAADGTWRQATKKVTTRRPVMDEFPVLDAKSQPVIDWISRTESDAKGGKKTVQVPTPRMHQVPRTRKVTVTQVDMVDQPGRRTHAGFRADEVKAAIPLMGNDWGAYVQAEDGTEHIRPDQLVPVLWKANQELLAEVNQLKAAMLELAVAVKGLSK